MFITISFIILLPITCIIMRIYYVTLFNLHFTKPGN